MSKYDDFHDVFNVRIHCLNDHDIELGAYEKNTDQLFAKITVGALGSMEWTADVHYQRGWKISLKPDARYNCETVKGDWTNEIFAGILTEYEKVQND